MKRLLYLIIGLFLCACTENIGPDPSLSSHQGQTQLLEEAFPNRPKELITLPNGTLVEKLDSIYILGGDVLLTKDQIDQMSDTRSAFNNVNNKKWPMGIVFYNIHYTAIPIKNRIESAIAHIESHTNIRFFEKTPFHSNYVNFICGNGNWSHMGMTGGAQDLSLAEFGSNTGSAIHEICHALGFFHEQSRSDRENFITINWDNIEEEKKHNFQTYTQNGYSNGIDIGVFDFNSIMLYSSYNSFAIDSSKPTMTKKDGSTFTGQRTGLSPSDIAAIKSKYGFGSTPDLMWIHAGGKTERDEFFNITEEYTNIHLVPKKTPTEDMKIEICVSYYQTTTMQDIDDWEWGDTYTITIPAGTRYTTFSYRNLWYQENKYGWKNITGSITSISPEPFEYRNF